MHAIELLLDDHENVATLFERVRSTGDGPSLFAQIRSALESHRHIEEMLFYPTLLAGGDEELQTTVESAIDSHRQVGDSLLELADLTEDEARFSPRLKVMMEDVERHVEEEEERIFPLAEDQFDPQKLERLGDKMEAERSRLLNT